MQTVENSSGLIRRMRAYRARLRAAGLRPVQIWVPDVRAPRLAEEASRQSLLASRQAVESETLAFIEQAADTGGEQ
jgi:Protein  of unknown function (DUF3018)